MSGEDLEQLSMNCLNGLAHLHSQNKSHGNVQPAYLGYDKNSDSYMMMENLKALNAPEKTQVQRLLNKQELYMGPELYSKLANKNKK